MVTINRTYEERRQMNLKIVQIIDEAIEEWSKKGLTFFKNRYADPSDPDNWIYSNKKERNMVFNGELTTKDFVEGKAVFKVMDQKYFDWAMDVCKKTEKKLGLEVVLEELYGL